MSSLIVGRNGKKTVNAILEKMEKSPKLYAKFYKRDNSGTFWRKNNKKKGIGYVPKVKGKTIRWASCATDFDNHAKYIYNKARSIATSSSKGNARLILQDAGVPVPMTWTDQMDVEEFPVIARPERHRAGKNFWVCNNEDDLDDAVENGATYFSAVYPKTKEYRVHVGSGKVLVCQEKTGDEEQKKNIVWNHAENDFEFKVLKWSQFDYDVCKVAVDAVKALGLDFGAVDVLAFPEDESLPKAVVCEVNTSPSLANYGQTRYAKYFDWLLRSKEKREALDSSEFETGQQYAWTNEELMEG